MDYFQLIAREVEPGDLVWMVQDFLDSFIEAI